LREGLLVPVRGAVHRVRREEMPVREEGLRVRSNGGYRDVNVDVVPVKPSGRGEACYLILFEDAAAGHPPGDGAAGPTRAKGRGRKAPAGHAAEAAALREREVEREHTRTKQELAATREYLQSVIEQQEAANEELQSANEEVQSANEELQSINEE